MRSVKPKIIFAFTRIEGRRSPMPAAKVRSSSPAAPQQVVLRLSRDPPNSPQRPRAKNLSRSTRPNCWYAPNNTDQNDRNEGNQ